MIDPLELLHEPEGLPAFDLPDELARLYPGTLGFPERCVYANFVSTVDGVVALPALRRSNALIADHSQADRLLMGLLRACADVVLVGSGTLRGNPNATWAPEGPFPDAAEALRELRRRLGLRESPRVAILTTGASLPVGHPILEREPIVLTTDDGAERLRPQLPRAEIVAVAGGDLVDIGAALDALHERGLGRILSEGGPNLLGSLLDFELLDELFLTVSPLLAGRPAIPGGVLSLVEGVELLPERRTALAVAGIRRHGDHTFFRYRRALP